MLTKNQGGNNMSANNGNTTTNGTKPQTTQSHIGNTTIDGKTPASAELKNLYITTFNSSEPETTESELKQPRWFKRWGGVLTLVIGTAIIPLVGFGITRSQFNTEQIKNQNTIVKEYIDGMSSLIFDKHLKKDTKDARTIAESQTKTALRRLEDGELKGQIIRFLHESDLIKGKTAIKLSGANINDVNLKDASLPRIQLEGTYLNKADLSNAGLQGANLKKAKLQNANLQSAKLQPARVKITEYSRGRIVKITREYIATDLQGADLQNANLKEADLQGANLQEVKNLTPEQVKSAKNWEQACYDPAFNNELGLSTEEQEKNCEKFSKPN